MRLWASVSPQLTAAGIPGVGSAPALKTACAGVVCALAMQRLSVPLRKALCVSLPLSSDRHAPSFSPPCVLSAQERPQAQRPPRGLLRS